jgi:hypothetical protein
MSIVIINSQSHSLININNQFAPIYILNQHQQTLMQVINQQYSNQHINQHQQQTKFKPADFFLFPPPPPNETQQCVKRLEDNR